MENKFDEFFLELNPTCSVFHKNAKKTAKNELFLPRNRVISLIKISK